MFCISSSSSRDEKKRVLTTFSFPPSCVNDPQKNVRHFLFQPQIKTTQTLLSVDVSVQCTPSSFQEIKISTTKKYQKKRGLRGLSRSESKERGGGDRAHHSRNVAISPWVREGKAGKLCFGRSSHGCNNVLCRTLKHNLIGRMAHLAWACVKPPLFSCFSFLSFENKERS